MEQGRKEHYFQQRCHHASATDSLPGLQVSICLLGPPPGRLPDRVVVRTLGTNVSNVEEKWNT